ncbi:putative DNA-directed RNA polymerase III subunit RPC1 [Glarea lozoyensis 74030]|uniref:DNA-directed RNA polymerase III subunit RPC1 n=1 Tax=Glarea lozoyensis (strain ATCC 74030 / MF5533) TaxID=1104152 RepID=H0ENG1_GLAL7|nr:putative DNA-directed RNA polymerase III subunit RPC1 [Glarea lozoyensis 74030]
MISPSDCELLNINPAEGRPEMFIWQLPSKNLTYPERVQRHNIKKLQKCVRNGANIHPGAQQIIKKDSDHKISLKFARRENEARNLQIGDVVERHLEDGDIVLFNRQPSLHKLSIMSHYVKVRPWRTFRLNECVCNPYNADFDGDEMNLHVPQTEEARTEAINLMGVKNNLSTPKNGEPIISATQDFITAAYLLSSKENFFDRKTFTNISILKPEALWTGKQVFSVLMRPNKLSPVKRLVSIAYKETNEDIQKYNEGKLEKAAGCDLDESLENSISGKLSGVREQAGNYCIETLSKWNSPLIMAKSGSKGSNINVAQMVAVVGQQIIGGKRVAEGFQDRTLPHFLKNARHALAKGFVVNSFFTGLTPTEFLFHAISGREGLVDTAVKTAETGYMSRRLMKSLEDLSTQYDDTVRNSSGGVVQFQFGADKLDPVDMEGSAVPVNFKRTFSHAENLTWKNDDPCLLPYQVTAYCDEYLAEQKKNARDFVETIANHVKLLATKMANIREKSGLPRLEQDPNLSGQRYDATREDKQARLRVERVAKVSGPTLNKFISLCLSKYAKAHVEPGHAVGAVGAQSIGEPGTQMTLKTFHFAGVAGMSITQGVPRIKEIINASKVIKDVYIRPGCVFIKVNETTGGNLGARGAAAAKTKAKDEGINASELALRMNHLKRVLPAIAISGYPEASRAVINSSQESKNEVVVEGYGLRACMNTIGVIGTQVTSNSVMEMKDVLGIEAARTTIAQEIGVVMGQMDIDPRHMQLLADVMTYKGEVLGITRFGLSKMRDSVLQLASFEKTPDHLFDAAAGMKSDKIEGVSECIIMGQTMSVGTGAFQVVRRLGLKESDTQSKRTVFEDAWKWDQIERRKTRKNRG